MILCPASFGVCCLAVLSFHSPASAATFQADCGRTIHTVSKAVEDTFTFNLDATYVQLPGGTIPVTVPSGKKKCIKITFSVITDCPLGCFVRVDDNNIAVPPRWDQTTTRFSDSADGTRSFQWIEQVAAGDHQITIKVETGSDIEDAHFGPYTTVVEVMADPP
jgi:hypothetical protein